MFLFYYFLQFYHFLNFYSNQFPQIIRVAYEYVLMQTATFLKEKLQSTGLQPHFSVSVDKSTPHHDTNHAILIIIPVNGKRVAVPIDAPLVYKVNDDNSITGGVGSALAQQVVSVLKKDLEMNNDDLSYVRGETFQFLIFLSKMYILFVIIYIFFFTLTQPFIVMDSTKQRHSRLNC